MAALGRLQLRLSVVSRTIPVSIFWAQNAYKNGPRPFAEGLRNRVLFDMTSQRHGNTVGVTVRRTNTKKPRTSATIHTRHRRTAEVPPPQQKSTHQPATSCDVAAYMATSRASPPGSPPRLAMRSLVPAAKHNKTWNARRQRKKEGTQKTQIITLGTGC